MFKIYSLCQPKSALFKIHLHNNNTYYLFLSMAILSAFFCLVFMTTT